MDSAREAIMIGTQSSAVGHAALSAALDRLPRARFAMLPTPLVEAPRLSAEIHGPRIWLKREDLAGWGLGGSKYRILEFTLGQAMADGADVVVAGGLTRSNHPQQVVSAACHLGIPAVVLLGGGEGHLDWTGNLLLQGISGAEVHVLPTADLEEVRSAQATMADRLRERGRRPAIVTLTRSVHISSVFAYANYMAELVGQMDEAGIKPKRVYIGSGGPTYAGLIFGAAALGVPFEVVGVTPRGTAAECSEHVIGLIEQTSRILGLDVSPDPRTIRVTDSHVGPGYGVLTPEAIAAIRLTAATEGVFLDPVYTGKAMAALIAHARNGDFDADDTVVFAHTGGTPNLFAYASQLMSEPPPVG
jgi:1-aminocyclopropane-1-carboxylate deaminase/D-cysteine desulfhydrase-like pyridoxal-dependent ACC family enzyme